MIILDKPYVSDFLIETIKKNNFRVLDNEIARKYFNKEYLTDPLSIKDVDSELFYSNSENSINWISKNFPYSKLNKMIKISKNKALFREKIKDIFPDYFYTTLTIDEINNYDIKKLKFPLILKPCVGFLSFGVYPVGDEFEWDKIKGKIKSDIEKLKGFFPDCVFRASDFLIEEMIEGDEYALDGYFDNQSNAVILNIFHHPFFDDKDVSDRLYYTSGEIIKKYLNPFSELLDKIASCTGFKNFPFHLELRAKGDKIIPIEINPLRFCGWSITDISKYSIGINTYEYFLKQLKPDWDKILSGLNNDLTFFTIAEIPSCIDKEKIEGFDYEKYLSNFSNLCELRKIDYKNNPIFAIVFAKTNSIDEIKKLLKLDMKEFILSSQRKN